MKASSAARAVAMGRLAIITVSARWATVTALGIFSVAARATWHFMKAAWSPTGDWTQPATLRLGAMSASMSGWVADPQQQT